MLPSNRPFAAFSDVLSTRNRLFGLASIALSRFVFSRSASGSKSGKFRFGPAEPGSSTTVKAISKK